MTSLRCLPIVLGFALSSGQIASAAAEDAAPTKDPARKPTKQAQVQADFKAISGVLLIYRTTSGQFPTEEQGLEALINKPKAQPVPKRWTRMAEGHPVDPWGFPYGYAVRNKDGKERYFLVSKGPDKDSDKDDLEFEVKPPEAVEKK